MNIFGTDGIRGTYGKTITDETAFALGKSLAEGGEPLVVAARDSRLSGEKLQAALFSGVWKGGGNVIDLGILPTNAVSHFVRKFGADFGVMISASHNPPQDNGLKVFDRYGVKICAEKQRELSERMQKNSGKSDGTTVPSMKNAAKIYCADLKNTVGVRFDGLPVALDCCYGAASPVAAKLFKSCGAVPAVFCGRTDGARINVGCGATHPEYLAERMTAAGCVLGFSFDGDADRLAVCENGRVLDNHAVFLALAKYFAEKGEVRDAVVGTVLTNGGLENALAPLSLRLLRSDVGDGNMYRLMTERGLVLAGEESGHYLLSRYACTSDALLTALFVGKIFKEKGSLAKYTGELTLKDSKKVNIDVERLQTPPSEKTLENIASRVQKQYPSCRLVLRKSGTENKIRAYFEGEGIEEAEKAVTAALTGA